MRIILLKKIKIKISSNGYIQAETINMEGRECQKYLHIVEQLTDSISVDSKYKESFYQQKSEKIESSSISEDIINSFKNNNE